MITKIAPSPGFFFFLSFFLKQLSGLEALYQKYKDRGFTILGFPCNQFGGQEPENDEGIASFCLLNHGVTFPLMSKSDVNGDDTNEVYKWLKSQKAGLLGLTRIKVRSYPRHLIWC